MQRSEMADPAVEGRAGGGDRPMPNVSARPVQSLRNAHQPPKLEAEQLAEQALR